MMAREVYVIGVGMHPFGKHGVGNRKMAFAAGTAALGDAGIAFRDVGYLYNGYIGGAMMEGVTIAKDLGLSGAPIVHVENASATGSSAFREAVLAVAGGTTDIAMALGFDDVLARQSGLPGGNRRPRIDSVMLPAGFFAMWAVRRMHDNGTTEATFAKIAAKNWNHARFNPFAQRRADHQITTEEVLAADMVAYPHTAMMACATGSGAACAIVATRNTAQRLANGRPLVKVLASQLRSETYTEGHIFLGAVVGPAELTRSTATLAYEEELLGICGDGEGDRLVADGDTMIGGRIPFSTDGGLIARGHPGGPTGLAQVWDATQQLRGESGPRQVDGADTALIHMMGAGSVCAIHILQRE
jgi:acetyl-CoA acetyltransferase